MFIHFFLFFVFFTFGGLVENFYELEFFFFALMNDFGCAKIRKQYLKNFGGVWQDRF